jgi:hypothetical protein
MIPKYSGYIVEIHNFSYFDGILLFRNLTTLGYKVESIQRDGRLIDTKITFGKKRLDKFSRFLSFITF